MNTGGELLGRGIFTWDGVERRSLRYGSVALNDTPYNEAEIVERVWYPDAIAALIGKRVLLTASVVATRDSGHLGDMALGIKPSRPEECAIIELGIGTLASEKSWDDSPNLILLPEDGRSRFWYDPRILYRLHDQTVNLYGKETTRACAEPYSHTPIKPHVISNGDGSMQFVGVANEGIRVDPRITRLGDGLIMVEPPGRTPAGTRHSIIKGR